MTALPSTRRADALLGEVLTSPTDLPLVGELLPCLPQACVTDEITEPAVGTLTLNGTFKLLTQARIRNTRNVSSHVFPTGPRPLTGHPVSYTHLTLPTN